MKIPINKKGKYAQRFIPYMWPWSHPDGIKYPNFWSWVMSRKFSLFYTLTIWVLLGILGYAARRNCDEGPWQIVFQCDWSVWMGEYKTNFWHFLGTSFTAPWFHNDLPHLLFVTFFGFFFPVQSFEAQHGTKATITIYFLSYVFVLLFVGWLFNTLLIYWPDVHGISYPFTRAWMGGSVGIFALIGGLSYFSKKKWFTLSLVLVFELINHFIIGMNYYISLYHICASLFGWFSCWIWENSVRFKLKSY
ncbi:rhomboid family intramembrane serine protease [Ekhidna sp.]|uniref:rhomboid family intramembrane serine protease n=1 Tax=Ekhidna sp. TaxID=2608089 RepID=UPI003B50FADB